MGSSSPIRGENSKYSWNHPPPGCDWLFKVNDESSSSAAMKLCYIQNGHSCQHRVENLFHRCRRVGLKKIISQQQKKNILATSWVIVLDLSRAFTAADYIVRYQT